MPVIKCLSDLATQTSALARSWSPTGQHPYLWFRGQGKTQWPLVPSLYRNIKALSRNIEENHLAEFKMRSPQLEGGDRPKTDWEWYYLMQHHGCPTRLLDWTDSSLVALYFAIRGNFRCDSAVWVLDPRWLNHQTTGVESVALAEWEAAEPYLPTRKSGKPVPSLPIAIDPLHVTRRLASQRGHFTVHGEQTGCLCKMFKTPSTTRIAMLTVEKSSHRDLEYELSCCGITDVTIYPDLEGLSRDLIRRQRL